MPAAAQQLEVGRTLVCFDSNILLGHRAEAQKAWAAIEAGGGSRVQALVPLVGAPWHFCLSCCCSKVPTAQLVLVAAKQEWSLHCAGPGKQSCPVVMLQKVRSELHSLRGNKAGAMRASAAAAYTMLQGMMRAVDCCRVQR